MALLSLCVYTVLYGVTQWLRTGRGLFRTFGYLGSIASSAIISIVFHTGVSDHGLHVIAIIMTAVSVVALIITVADRRLMAQRTVGR